MVDQAKLAMFGRLKRLRTVQRRLALAALAGAQSEDRRLTNLAKRSETMASDYSALNHQMTADDLAARAHFGSQIAALARSAEAMGDQARAATEAATDNFAQANRSLETASQRYREARVLAISKAEQRIASTATSLARRLQNEEDTATGQTGE
ncbi:hypothetical protein [Erythrobacter sp. MTPC3]|uniref:hypothetical protein n=1 Tax=Erythrobacter sp. MTPC3 TaxID=3056564 RepID=UPI0036F3FEB3